MGKYRKPV